MNKLFIVAVFAACVGLSATHWVPSGLNETEVEETQLSLAPADDLETQYLEGDYQAFSSFCTESRDYIATDIKQNGDLYASHIFGSLFRGIGEVTSEVVKANQLSTERIASQLENPQNAIPEGKTPLDKLIAQAQEEVKRTNGSPQGFVKSFLNNFNVLRKVGYMAAVNSFNKLKGQVEEMKNEIVSVEKLVKFCDQLTSYEATIKDMFEETKAKVVSVKPSLSSATFAQVGGMCLTASRVIKSEGFCRFVQVAREPLLKAVNFNITPRTNAEA